MRHLSEADLNDYADGALAAAAQAAAEEHLRECPTCAAELAALRRLLASAARLPLSLEPPVHLWSAVRRETVDARLNRRHMLWELRAPLAAAALLLVTIASGVTYLVTRDQIDPQVAQAAAEPSASATLGLARAEADYLEAARTLIEVLQERRSTMDPVLVQAVEENLQVMEREIQEAKAALAADSLNQNVAAILNATYQYKVQMLRRAVRLTGET